MTLGQCEKDNCKLPATHAPRINIPPNGYSKEEKHSIKTLVGIKLCLHHANNFDIKDIVRESDFQEATLYAVSLTGSTCPPDFKRAWVVAVALDSPEYISFEAMQAKKQ